MSIFTEPRVDTDKYRYFYFIALECVIQILYKKFKKNEKILRESVDMYDTVSYIFLQQYDIMS